MAAARHVLRAATPRKGAIRAWHARCTVTGMNENLQITFRGMSSSPAIELLIRERTERLARFSSLVQRCHVVVEQPHRHHHKGRAYSVRLDLVTPADEVVVSRESDECAGHAPLQSAIRDAFDAATRQLEERLARRRSA